MSTELLFHCLDLAALTFIGIGVWKMQSNRSPDVEVNVPEPPQPLIKVVMPRDIEAARVEAQKIQIEHRQPDGTWHLVGETTVENEQRIALELATEGRRIVMPDGEIRENA